MGGQRKGSLKDRSELEFSYRRKELLNLALFDTQLRSKNKVERNDAEVDLCLRYILLKKDHERRVNEIESRIEQSTCSAKTCLTRIRPKRRRTSCIYHIVVVVVVVLLCVMQN
jgi:hypothetical protein